jgi:hypothetical protein
MSLFRACQARVAGFDPYLKSAFDGLNIDELILNKFYHC